LILPGSNSSVAGSDLGFRGIGNRCRPLGGGLGAFPYFFPGYRDATVGPEFGMIDKAHNTYLELAAELGVPMTAALVIGLGWLVVRMVRANPRWSRRRSCRRRRFNPGRGAFSFRLRA
jgi:hypothetical protein